MPAVIDINGVPGSNESAVDLTGLPASQIVFDNSAAAGPTVNLWEFLEWPVGSLFNQTWLLGVGATGATVTIPVPDMSGTWVVKYTDTNDGTTDTIICGIKNRRTSLRIPGAGETTESDNTIFPAGGAITNHRGWALTRDLGLKYLDDLVTSGAVQIFYLEDGTIPAGGINAGTPLALVQGAPEVLFPGTAPAPYNVPIRVPKVHMAQADSTSSRYAYVGVLKAGRDAAVPAVSNASYGYITTAIPSGTFVWVATSGAVQGEAATGGAGNIATLGFTVGGWAVGHIAYLSGATAGALVQDTDTFAVGSTASNLMTPVGIVGDVTNAQGSLVVLPNLYQGNPVANATTEMYRGIGDYSSLRVGRTDFVSVAGEQDGTIELCAIAGENITAGNIVCISTNGGGVMQAFVADSSESPAIANNKKYGIFGVAIQTVAITNLGHFTIFGEANATTVAPAVGLLYVGSSSGGAGSTAGTATILSRIDDTVLAGTYLDYPAIPIPLGVWDGTKLILGTTQDAGLIATVSSTGRSSSPLPININEERNTTDLSFDKANVWRDRSAPSSTTLVDFPNTEADSLMMTTSVYEDTIKGSDLYDITNQVLGGKVWTTPPAGQVVQDMPGASINSGTWTGLNGGGVAPRNEVYGTFVLEDARYFDQLIPVAFEVHGYTDSHTINSNMLLQLTARVNYRGNNTLGPFTTLNVGRITTGTVADTNGAFTAEYFSVTGAGNAFYVPKYDAAGGVFYSIDIILERIDVVNASLMVEKVVFQSLYLNKNISLNQGYPPVVFEKKVPGYTLINTRTNTFNVLDIGPAPGTGIITDPTVGASMSTVPATGISDLVGFIPYDTRIQNAAFLNVMIIGKYTGTNVGATALNLNFTYEEVTAPNTYNPSIFVAGVTLNDTFTPAGTAAAGDYEAQRFLFQIPNPNASASGIRFKIVRAGVVPIVGETSFQISNVYFETSAVTSYGVIEDVYEESTTATDVIDIDDALNIGTATDFTGFLFPTPAAPSPESLFIPVKFDKRYNYRENINVEVFGYVTAASATDINLELAISNFYDHAALAPQTGALFTTIQRHAVDISAAGNVYLIKHTFVLAAKDIWNSPMPPSLSPYYTQFRDSGNSGLLLRLKRNDAAAVNYTTTNVRVYTRAGKKSNSEGLYVNLSEDITSPQHSYLEVKSAYRADRPYSNTYSAFLERNLLGSAHRYYFNYSTDDTTIANLATATVFPAGVGTALAARPYGCIVPFNMAIVGIYGFGDEGAGPVPAGVTIRLSLIDSLGVVLNTNSGVLHMPVDTVSLTSGWRWTANPLNFNIPGGTADFHEIPLVYLPSNYSSTGWEAGPPPVPVAFAGTSWLLKCEAINNSGGSIDLTANITVEAVLLPDFNVAD